MLTPWRGMFYLWSHLFLRLLILNSVIPLLVNTEPSPPRHAAPATQDTFVGALAPHTLDPSSAHERLLLSLSSGALQRILFLFVFGFGLRHQS